MSDDLSLNVTMFLQHKTDFAENGPRFPGSTVSYQAERAHGISSVQAKPQYTTPGKKDAPRAYSYCGKSRRKEVAVSQVEGPESCSWWITGEQRCSVSIWMLLGGKICPHTPTGPVRSTSSNGSQAGQQTAQSHGLPGTQSSLLKSSTF